ncbi:MAG: hypothetical protein SRB2_01051 [Desulfobacteraceae bacterium Eth-SRB2]|nr:MAG: hypothetical protein SRB2_01051 [Desulfobacteraceae bacterium Eth-SRB2]
MIFLFFLKTALNAPVYLFQYFPNLPNFRCKMPFFGFRGIIFALAHKLIEMHFAPTILLIVSISSGEISGEYTGDFPSVVNAPVLGNVMPGFTKGGKVFCPGI